MTQLTNLLISLVGSYGLLAIFVTMAGESAGLPISSEIVVPLGGALAAQGKLNFIAVVAVSSLANLAGSLVAYILTRRYGEQVILSRAGRWMGLSRGHLRLANRFFGKYGVWAVFLGRLLPIVRTYISFPAGLSKVRLLTFTIATLAGAMTALATSTTWFGLASTARCRIEPRWVTKTTRWRLATRCMLSISSSAVIVSTKSVNRITSARRFSRAFSSARPSVKLVSWC